MVRGLLAVVASLVKHTAPGTWASAVAVCGLGGSGSRALELGHNGCGTWA